MTPIFRRFESRDREPVYRLFRESIWDYMLQQGIVSPGDANEIDRQFEQQQGLYLHLEATAAADWVACDDRGGLLGWARSIERDGHLQLTHFFVDTRSQGGGIGRGLLDRVFPLEAGQQRSVIATTNPLALSLYLRYGVSFQGMAFSMYGKPGRRITNSDLEVEHAQASAATLEKILSIDARIIGYRRPTDLGYFMRHQPVFLFHRGGRLVAYAFGCDGLSAGPAAALSAEDLPALLQHIENSACQVGVDELWLTLPANAAGAVSWALASGYRIDPFHEVLLSGNAALQLDRYIMTQSAFLW